MPHYYFRWVKELVPPRVGANSERDLFAMAVQPWIVRNVFDKTADCNEKMGGDKPGSLGASSFLTFFIDRCRAEEWYAVWSE